MELHHNKKKKLAPGNCVNIYIIKLLLPSALTTCNLPLPEPS